MYMRVASFIWTKMRTIAQAMGFQITLKNCSKEVEGKDSMYVILVKVGYKQPNRFCRKFLLVTGAVFTMQDFRALLGMIHKNWGPKIVSWTCLSEDLFCQFFPKHIVPHFWSPPWAPFMGCWRSAAAASRDLTPVEVDGKCQFVVDINSKIFKYL